MSEIGPNVKRLIAYKMAQLAIPVGSGKESFAIGLEVLTNKELYLSTATEAQVWVQEAILGVKMASNCPFNTDEDIAAEALRRMADKK